MFFMRIFHQRHENRLHLLIARVLFVRLSWSKIQGIPETFFVTYHQETIVKSSQLLQNMVLNTRRVVHHMYSHSSHMQSRFSILSKDLICGRIATLGFTFVNTNRDFMDVKICFSFHC